METLEDRRLLTTAAFPTPLEAFGPPGSLVYHTSLGGTIESAEERDSLTVDLDDGQSVSVVVEGEGSLWASVELVDPASTVVGPAAAVGAGGEAVIQSVATSGAGTYTVNITGLSDTTGSYRAALVLNASVEEEGNGGPANDGAAMAEDLDGRFHAVGFAASERTAVLGSFPTAPDVDEDWYRLTLQDGQPVSLTVSRLGDSASELELYAADGTLLARGVPSANTGRVISDFVDTTSDATAETYFARVTGADQDYALVITREAVFELEANGTFGEAHDISLTGTVYAALGRSGSGDIADVSAAYVRSIVGSPWDSTFNEMAMDVAFGAGRWDDLRFETVNPDQLFSGDYSFVFMEGSEFTSDEMETFLVANISAMEDYVSAGNGLFLNSAPNEGDGMSFGFGGVILGPPSSFSSVSAVAKQHPVFLGPHLPTATTYNGSSFAHSAVTGDHIVPILEAESSEPVLAELPWGAGRVLFGGMTPPDFHSPGFPAENLRANILHYGAALDRSDLFSLAVEAGDALSIEASTPAAGPGEFLNPLDLAIELYDPSETLVANTSDGMLQHTAAEAGAYFVRVTGDGPRTGEYVLHASGHTGPPTPFRVVSTNPEDGTRTRGASDHRRIRIELSHTILLPSLDAADLLFNGNPAEDVTLIDGDTLQFPLPAWSVGVNTVSIPTGALMDVRGQPIEAFQIEFELDRTGPRVTDTSIQEGGVVPANLPLVYTVRFDEELDATILRPTDPADLLLEGEASGRHSPTDSHYEPESSTLTLEYAGLPEDEFTLTLSSSSHAFTDTVGNPLDGEPTAFPIPPNQSGNGGPGGDFVLHFSTDFTTSPFPLPLEARLPIGSLAYETTIAGSIAPANDVDRFTIDVDDGQTITVWAETAGSLRATMQLIDPTGAVLATSTAGVPGQPSVIQSVPTTGAGRYTASITGIGGSRGAYTLGLALNAAQELEEYGGQSNEFSGFAQDLDPSMAPLGSGPGERVAVLGNLSAEPGAATDWYRFTLDDGDSAALALTSHDPATLELVLYDDAPTPLAMGTPAGNSDHVINGFVDATSDGEPNTYFVRVVGDGADYSLVVMRNADFDTEPLDTVTTAFQDITLNGTVLGGLPSSTSPSRETASGTTSLPLELVDGTGFRWDIRQGGGISPGLDDAYDQGLIRFDFSSFSTGQSDLGGREVVLGPDLEGDVELWRKVYIPEDQGFARFLEIVTNRSDSSANYSFVVSSDFGSDTSTRIISTASGDDVFDVEDDWIVTDDFSDGDIDPTLLHVVAGPGGIRPSFAAFVPIDDLAVEYDLNLAPGETQIVMHFAAKNVDRATALEKGPLLTDLGLGALAGMTDAERAQTVNFDIGISDDYAVEVQEGDVLSISTSLPAAGPFEFDNRLDIGVELYDPGGSLVESHGGGTFQHTALEDGTYHVRVHGNDGTAGEYVLNVSGHTGGLPPFEVSGTDPADGSRFRISPDKLQIDFSDHVLLPTAAASDLLIHGTPALDLDVLDGNTLQFHLPELVEGANTISIAAGALLDVQGQPVSPFEMELIIDTTAPRVVNSSIQQDDTVPTGTLVYVAEFDEPLLGTDLDASDVMLIGQQTGPHVPASFHYDPATSVVTVEYTGLVEDQFTLTLLSGSGAFEDLLGYALDGEPLAFPLPPNRSGNGSPGGNFTVEFATDFVAHPFPVPLEAKQPLGSLVYDPQIDGRIDTSSDVDRFTIDVDDGQTITVLVEGQPPLQPNIVLLDPGGLEIGAAEAGSSGGAAILQTVPTNGAGTYTVEVTGVTGSTGRYAVQLYLNAALEFEPHTGLANDGLASSEDLDGSFISLGFGSAERGAVVGSGAFGSAANLGAGVNTASGELNPTVSADGLTVLFNSDRAGGLGGQDLYMATRSDLSEPFGNVTNLGPAINTSGTETAPALSADGLSLYFASIRPGSENLDLYVATRASASEPFGNVVQLDFPVNTVHHDSAPAISSDGLSLYFTSNRPGFGGNDIYVATRSHVADPFITVESLGEEINTAGAETRPELSHDGLSLYFTSNRAGGFGLEDLYVTRRVSVQAEFGPPVNLGPQVNTAAAERGPTLSLDENLLLFDSDRTGGHGAGDLYSATREDWYRFTLADGATASLAVRGSAASNMQIELYDDGGALLALGSGGVGPEAVISSFLDTTTDAAADTYHVRVSGITETYTLVVTRDAAWDTDPNPTPGLRAQDITPTGTVVGHVGATREGGRLFVYDAALDEIQELDPQTGRKIHRFPSPISAAPGPDFGMASTPTTLLAGGSVAEDIVELDPDTGEILRRIPNPGVAISGMAFLDERIHLLTDAPVNLRTILDYTTGAMIGQVEADSLYEALAATPNVLLGVNGTDLYRVETFTDNKSFLGVCGGGISFTDAMGVIGNELYVGDSTAINVYELDVFSELVTLDRTLPGMENVEAIAADGHGVGGIDRDVFRVQVNAGDTLNVATHIPAAGPLEFLNSLDLGIELYDPSGDRVAMSPDGSLVHTAAATGSYSIRVFAENGTQGEYVLNVSGHTGQPLPFEVTASNPADGVSSAIAPSTLRIDLSGPVLAPSVAAADLMVNGGPATGVTLIDGDTVEFALPPLADGENRLSIAAGAITSLAQQPLEAFAIDLSVDHVAPRIVGTSIQAGDTVASGVPLTVTIEFDEPLRDLSVMPGGLLGEYYLPGGSVNDYPDFDALAPVHRRIDPIIHFPRVADNFGGFHDLDENFAVRWRGQILIEEPGSVGFSLRNSLTSGNDDHARLFINDILVADTSVGSFPGSGSIDLTRGLHDIRIEYFSGSDHSQVLFFYRPINGSWLIVPDSVLLRSAVSLRTQPSGNPSAPVESYTPKVFSYDPVGSKLTLEYPPLPEGLYQLAVHGELGEVEDRAGHPLDGEAAAFPLPPNVSGDGTAGGDFVVNFAAENQGAPFPLPFEPKQPLGSLIQDPLAEGIINAADDVDEFTLDLDADQTLTVLVTSERSLRSTGEVRSPDGVVLAAVTAALAGERVLLQTVPITDPGTYSISVQGEDGTLGGYQVRAVLNAALEEEENGGQANNIPQTAQDLDAGFIPLGLGSAQRTAVLGNLIPMLPPRVVIREGFESGSLDDAWTTSSTLPEGRIRVTGDHGTAGGSFALIMDRDPEGPPNLNEAVWRVDVSGIVEPTLNFFHVDFVDNADALPESFSGSVNGDGVSISDNGVDWFTILNAPSEPSGLFTHVSYDLGETAAAAGMALDGEFFVKFQQWNGAPVPIDGRGVDEITITTPEPLHEDWYRVTLADGETMSLVLTADKAGAVELELFDSGMNPLETGTPATNVDRVIQNFIDTTTDGSSDQYFVKVVGDDTDYSLLVTRGADFDPGWSREPSPANPDLGPSGTVFGYLGDRVLEDFEDGNLHEYSEVQSETQFTLGEPAAHDGRLGLRSSRGSLGWIVRTDGRAVVQRGDTLSFWASLGDLESAPRFLFGASENAHLGVTLGEGRSLVLFERNGDVFTTLADVSQFFHVSHWYRVEVDWGLGGEVTARMYDSDGSTLIKSISANSSNTITWGSIGFQSRRFNTYIDTVELLDGRGVQQASYAVELQAGERLVARTAVPAGGPGQFINTLDPRLTVLDPTGVPIASDSDSLDGKNARVNFVAAEAGIYTVQVGAESGRGEYVLGVESLVAGDMNGDGVVDIDDAAPFVTALVDRASYEAAFGLVAHVMGDLDGDGDLDVDDVGTFRELLTGGGGGTAAPASLAADPVTAPASASPMTVGGVSNPSQVGWVFNPSQVGWVSNPSLFAARTTAASIRRDGLKSHPTNDPAVSDTVAQVARGIVETDREARRRVGFARSHMVSAEADRATEPPGRSHGEPDRLLDHVWQEDRDWRRDAELG